MPKAKKRKDSTFTPKQVKSVFLYGSPNTGKRSLLHEMQDTFCSLVNRDIQVLGAADAYLLQLVKNDKKDSAMRKLEKTLRPEGLNSAFCQAAFDMAVVKLSGRLDDIRLDMYAQEQTIFTQSKVLFAMSAMGRTKGDMIAAMEEISKGKECFHSDCAQVLKAMDDGAFRLAMLQFQDAYACACMERKVPSLSRAEMPLDSRLMKLEASTDIQAPYVITITDPFKKNHRFSVPLDTSRHSLHKIRCNPMAGTVNVSMDRGKLRVAWGYTRKLVQPRTAKAVGLDTGITDLFHSSDDVAYASLKGPIDFYKQEVEPAFAALSCLRNKKRAISHYLHTHPGIPEDAGRSLIQKMDRLEHMIQTMDAPYRKKRHYYGILDKAIKDGVTAYIQNLEPDTLTVIERLDMKEFNKSRRENGRYSMFARGKAQQALMAALNWKGYDFVEVAPEYTSKVCPVCQNLDPENRHGKLFHCTCCGYTADADYVGGINIRERATDAELMDVCKKNHYSHKNLTEALKILYKGRNDKYKQQHPPVTAAGGEAPASPDAA